MKILLDMYKGLSKETRDKAEVSIFLMRRQVTSWQVTRETS